VRKSIQFLLAHLSIISSDRWTDTLSSLLPRASIASRG